MGRIEDNVKRAVYYIERGNVKQAFTIIAEQSHRCGFGHQQRTLAKFIGEYATDGKGEQKKLN